MRIESCINYILVSLGCNEKVYKLNILLIWKFTIRMMKNTDIIWASYAILSREIFWKNARKFREIKQFL